MIVLDASAVVEFLRGSGAGSLVLDIIEADGENVHLPYLCAVEVTNVFRTLVARGETSPERGVAALADMADFPARRWPAEPFLARIWELRHSLTAYDAHYVALAEALDAALVTRDRRLAAAIGHDVSVQLID